MEPLRIVATTPAGFASSDPWSPSIDGILAYWLLREQLGEEEFALGMTGQRPLVTPSDLPLERVESDGQWWWACSSPLYQQRAEYLHWYHRRFDALLAEQYVQERRSTGKVRVTAGPYKNYRLAATIHVCPEVIWYVVGDQAEIERLLHRCSAIGAKVAGGCGRVTDWVFSADGAYEPLARYHRPLPVTYAAAQGLDGMRLNWGIRPPGRLRENQCLCTMPG